MILNNLLLIGKGGELGQDANYQGKYHLLTDSTLYVLK